jgi:hypothetical protein
MACFPPVRPSVPRDPRVFNPWQPPPVFFRSVEPLLSCTSTPPKRLAPTLATTPSVPCRPWSGKNRTSHKLPALQHIRMQKPFFSPPVARRRLEAVALAPRSLTLGFGYPLDEMAWLPHPGGPLSAPNALGLRSSELSSSRVIEKPFRVPLPLLHFPAKPLRPCPGAPPACSHPESRAPFLPPECLARVGTSCSLELSDLAGSPPAGCEA